MTTHELAGTHARSHARASSSKEKLNGRNIRTTLLYRSVREIRFGIDEIHVWFTRAKNPEEQLRFAKSYGSRICIWKKMGGLLRIRVET